MRYIRDIINDKKRASEDFPDRKEPKRRAPEASTPLVLNEPIFPDTTETAEETAVAASFGMEPAREAQDDTASPAPTPNVVPTRVDPSERQSTTRRLQYRTPPPEKAEEETEGAALQTDPFEKVRETARMEQDAKVTVSPLRPSPEPAEPKQQKETQSEAQTVESETPPAKETEEETLTPLVDALDPDKIQMPKPSEGRGSKVSTRVKTRLLGFSADAYTADDPFKSGAAASNDFPVGWLVVVSEKGRGKSFALGDGVSSVGRGTDQAVCLDFGDTSISRENHVSIAFDAEQGKFFIGHGGKSNLVRLNNKPLLSTEELNSKDMIRLGETTLRFMAFCDDAFSWSDGQQQAAQSA